MGIADAKGRLHFTPRPRTIFLCAPLTTIALTALSRCLAGRCALGATCGNTIKDGLETDVNCGGFSTGCFACCYGEQAGAQQQSSSFAPEWPVCRAAATAMAVGAALAPSRSLSHPCRPEMSEPIRLPVRVVR